MSLFGSLFTGVSGLSAQSRSMGIISDNVANVNTTGYKGAFAQFSNLVTSIDMRSAHSPGGVMSRAQYVIGKQGIVQSSSSATDAAITGAGFFVVNESADSQGRQLYTRAGSFLPDALGNLRMPTGQYLQGWRLDENEAVIDNTKVETVNTRAVVGTTSPTTSVSLGANLDSGQAPYTGPYAAGDLATWAATSGVSGVEPDFASNILVYDSLGNARTLTLGFKKNNTPGQWLVEVYTDPTTVEIAQHPNGRIASGTLTFNGDGTLQTAAVTPIYPPGSVAGDPLGIDWLDTSGANDSSITFDWGTPGTSSGFTQFAGESAVVYFTRDGTSFGQLNNVRIDEEGYVVASFTNGTSRRIYLLPIATFANPAALDPLSGNVFGSNRNSLEPNLLAPGVGGAGVVTPLALEAANVDLADEFSKMIITQRAYSANARVITTTDDMLDELIRLRR